MDYDIGEGNGDAVFDRIPIKSVEIMKRKKDFGNEQDEQIRRFSSRTRIIALPHSLVFSTLFLQQF